MYALCEKICVSVYLCLCVYGCVWVWMCVCVCVCVVHVIMVPTICQLELNQLVTTPSLCNPIELCFHLTFLLDYGTAVHLPIDVPVDGPTWNKQILYGRVHAPATPGSMTCLLLDLLMTSTKNE